MNSIILSIKPKWASLIYAGKKEVECGVNGCCNEDLLNIVKVRLEGFQNSEFACRENAEALTKLEEALLWLHHRTNKRVARGVEGTHTV